MARPKRKDIEIEETRRRIVDAAVRLFARRGYDASSMQDIAAEADYSAPSLYKYFKGKEAIFEALLESLYADLKELFDVVLPRGLTLAQKLELLLMPQAAWVDANQEAFVFLGRREGAVLLAESGGFDSPVMATLYTEWFAENTTAEERGGASPDAAGFLLSGICHGLYGRWMVHQRPASTADVARAAIASFLGGVGGGGAQLG